MEDKKKYVKRNIKNISNAILGSVELLGGVVGTAFNPIVGIPITIDGAQRMLKGISGEYIKGSMINVMSNKFYSKTFHKKENRIVQELPSPRQFITASLLKDKTTFLLMQELNFLLGSDTLDKKGERITYSTHSQGITKFMLNRLQKAGMIQDFTCEETKPKSLALERAMLGNINKKIFDKTKMYEMTFSKTDKQLTEEDIKKFLKIDALNEDKYDIKRDKDSNITNVNYKTVPIIKNSLNKAKEKYLPSKDKPKMLKEANEVDKEKEVQSQDEFKKDLRQYVKPKEQMVSEKVEVKENTTISLDLDNR